jgi:orotate phosphoribosyltransferase
VTQHYDSLRAHNRTDVGNRIVIVDDVVTKGSTALAAASCLAEVYPNAEIRLYAAIRTKGIVPDIDQILDPVSGTIQLVGDEGHRQP